MGTSQRAPSFQPPMTRSQDPAVDRNRSASRGPGRAARIPRRLTNPGRRGKCLAAAGMPAAAAKLGHVLGFLAMFRTVFAEFTVGWDRAGTTRMSALLRLIHNAPLLAGFVGTIVAQPRPGRGLRLWSQRGAAWAPVGVRPVRGWQACGERPSPSGSGGCCTSPYAPRWAFRIRRRFGPAAGARYCGRTAFLGMTWILRFRFYPETDFGARRFAESSKNARFAPAGRA